jgi:hypothetical protein
MAWRFACERKRHMKRLIAIMATALVASSLVTATAEDRRDWVLHVSDDRGDELFVVPFAFVP